MTTNVGCIDLDLGSSPYDNLSTTLDKAYDAIEDTNFGASDWTGSKGAEGVFNTLTNYSTLDPGYVMYTGSEVTETLTSFIDQIAPNLGLNDDIQKQALVDAAIALTEKEQGKEIPEGGGMSAPTLKLVAENIVNILEAADAEGDNKGDRGLRIEEGERTTDIFYVRDNNGSGSMQELNTLEQSSLQVCP